MLTEADQQRVTAAVAAAEEKSGGEITTAIIAESDDYGLREVAVALGVGVVMWAAAIAASGTILTVLERLFWSPPAWYLSVVQGVIALSAGFIAYAVVQIPAIDRLIIPRAVMAEAVARRARRHFVESGTYDTVDNTGVLIFVSLLERRVELIADRGIHAQVEPGTWDAVVADLTAGIRAGALADSLVAAVERCGEILAGRVVRRTDDTNELPDAPTELEKGS